MNTGLKIDPRADALQFALLNQWQRDFPLAAAPFDVLAQQLGVAPQAVLDAFARLRAGGALSRIGGVFGVGAGGASLLAAMAVPPASLEAVAACVSAQPGVNHNYAREHRVNLWFVLTGRDADDVEQVLRGIERETGLPVLRLPMLQPYGVDLSFDLARGDRSGTNTGQGAVRPWRSGVAPVSPADRPLAALLEEGLPLVRRPFDGWARRLGRETGEVLGTLAQWLAAGTLHRFGVIVRHHELGYTANAMTVFDVADERVDACGRALAAMPGVTLAYRRARAEGWPYNLYCMVHGACREAVRAQVAKAGAAVGLADAPREVLFSVRRFKQTGGRRFGDLPAPLAMPAAAPVQDEACDALA